MALRLENNKIRRIDVKIFDSHCHLDDKSFGRDMTHILRRMAESNVVAAMVVGINGKSSQKVVDLAEANENLYASVGVHPHDAAHCSENTITFLKTLARSPKVRAWGETGLDFNRMFSPKEDQEKWFIRQLEAADELGLPLILHERDSNGRFLQILENRYKKNGRKGVVHCFSGNADELDRYVDLGFHIGITGILTIKTRGETLRGLVTRIPTERLLVETDAPYLTPAPEKNKTRRNEPAFVRSVLTKLAETRNEHPEYLAEIIWKNTCGLFGIAH